MKTTAKKISDSRIELTVVLDAKDLEPFAEKALKKLARDVKVEGFRKGKAPLKIAQSFISPNDLNTETADAAVRATVIPAFHEVEKTPLVAPTVQITKYVPGETLEYSSVADIVPEVKLCNYKKLGVKKPKVTVTEEEIQDFLEDLRASFGEKKTVKRAVKLGDEAIIDFVGKKDGKAFDGGSAKDYKLTLGSDTFIPGFEDGIVGHEPGDKFELELTFPTNYPVAMLNGAKVVFEILVKQVNEIVKPELDDKFAAECGSFKTVEELKEDVRKNLEMRHAHAIEEQYRSDLVDALIDKSTVPAPEILVEEQIESIREDATNNAKSQKMSFEEFLEAHGETQESWNKGAHELAERRIQSSLALQNVALAEKITVPDDLVDDRVAKMKAIYKKMPEFSKQMKDPNFRVNIRNHLVIEATIDYLAEVNAQK